MKPSAVLFKPPSYDWISSLILKSFWLNTEEFPWKFVKQNNLLFYFLTSRSHEISVETQWFIRLSNIKIVKFGENLITYVLFQIIYAENTGRNLSEIRSSLNIFALTIIFRHNWACPQGFWNICYLIWNVENCLAILPPMECSWNSRHCKNDSSTVHKWGKLKMKKTKQNIFYDESFCLEN